MKKPSRIKTSTDRLAYASWALVAVIGCTLIGAVVYFALGLA
jgi:hypothetical protein